MQRTDHTERSVKEQPIRTCASNTKQSRWQGLHQGLYLWRSKPFINSHLYCLFGGHDKDNNKYESAINMAFKVAIRRTKLASKISHFSKTYEIKELHTIAQFLNMQQSEQAARSITKTVSITKNGICSIKQVIIKSSINLAIIMWINQAATRYIRNIVTMTHTKRSEKSQELKIKRLSITEAIYM